jgi:tRNA(fMet)-specific endonuclease VapC
MRYLLDTNICIGAMRSHPKIIARMGAVSPADCAISTITIYELYTGVEKCVNPAKERAKVDIVIQTFAELSFNAMAATQAAWVRAFLEARGQAIGPYDTLLAGQALVLGLIMVSANVNEFSRVPGLTVENWQA